MGQEKNQETNKKGENIDETGCRNNKNTTADPPQALPKISKIVFDEKTGTVTLKIASEEEIAEAEKIKKKSNEG